MKKSDFKTANAKRLFDEFKQQAGLPAETAGMLASAIDSGRFTVGEARAQANYLADWGKATLDDATSANFAIGDSSLIPGFTSDTDNVLVNGMKAKAEMDAIFDGGASMAPSATDNPLIANAKERARGEVSNMDGMQIVW